VTDERRGEAHLAVTRTARYVWLGQPGPHVREVWIACHGYGQLAARFLRRFEPIAHGGRLIVAPEALNRFYLDGGTGPHGPESRVGATWMTREDRLTDIEDYVAYLDELYAHIARDVPFSEVRCIALGFSQGVATICRWVARTRHRIDNVVLWAGTVPPEMDLATDPFRTADLTVAFGAEDPWASDTMVNATRQRFEEAGRPFRAIRFQGGHEITPAALQELATTLASIPRNTLIR
jgi:predicted esterase